MFMDKSNIFLELLARARYHFLHTIKKAEPVEHVEYRHHRWYRLDSRSRIIKVSRTYFDVMQPKQEPPREP